MVRIQFHRIGDVTRERPFGLQRSLAVAGQTDAIADTKHMRIDCNTRLSKRHCCHHICGLTPHAGQSLQRIVVIRHFASVSLHQPLCHTDQMLRFGIGVRDRFHQLINFFDRGRSQRLCIRETTK